MQSVAKLSQPSSLALADESFSQQLRRKKTELINSRLQKRRSHISRRCYGDYVNTSKDFPHKEFRLNAVEHKGFFFRVSIYIHIFIKARKRKYFHFISKASGSQASVFSDTNKTVQLQFPSPARENTVFPLKQEQQTCGRNRPHPPHKQAEIPCQFKTVWFSLSIKVHHASQSTFHFQKESYSLWSHPRSFSYTEKLFHLLLFSRGWQRSQTPKKKK